MGLIRKSLMLGTGGLVSGNSKKQRVAKSQLRELQAQTKLLEQIADPDKLERERAARQAAKDARQARIAATLEARHQRALERKQRLTEKQEALQRSQQQLTANRASTPTWASKTLRIVGWAWVIFLVLIAISAASVSVVGAVISALFAASLIWILVRKTIPRKDEAVPAYPAASP